MRISPRPFSSTVCPRPQFPSHYTILRKRFMWQICFCPQFLGIQLSLKGSKFKRLWLAEIIILENNWLKKKNNPPIFQSLLSLSADRFLHLLIRWGDVSLSWGSILDIHNMTSPGSVISKDSPSVVLGPAALPSAGLQLEIQIPSSHHICQIRNCLQKPCRWSGCI